MIKPRITPPEELEAARQFLRDHPGYGPSDGSSHPLSRPDGASSRQRYAQGTEPVVTGEGNCSRCGAHVDSFNQEPLDLEPDGHGFLTTISTVTVLLPCGDAFVRRTGATARAAR